MTSITMNSGATVDGRVLTQNGAVVLDNNTINAIPEPASVYLYALGILGVCLTGMRFSSLKVFTGRYATGE